MNRKYIIGGNWKMNKTIDEAKKFIAEFTGLVANLTKEIDIVLYPSFTAIASAAVASKGKGINIGAQNLYFEEKGAFTGEISAGMIRESGASHVIIGHSERRQIFGESDELVSKKLKTALLKGLKPIVCIGETKDERENGSTEQVLETQLRGSLQALAEPEITDADVDVSSVVIAYEPVWAIGTGLTATPDQAQDAHAYIRGVLSGILGEENANVMRIQYGGSIKPENAAELFSQQDIDGGLVGGASLEPKSLAEIIKSVPI
jgi:triosephosphate isomerase